MWVEVNKTCSMNQPYEFIHEHVDLVYRLSFRKFSNKLFFFVLFLKAMSLYFFKSKVMMWLHFITGASRVRSLPPEEFCKQSDFCKQSYVIAKAAEAGFGKKMYKILTAAAMSVVLNSSLIIGQTSHIGSISILAAAMCTNY